MSCQIYTGRSFTSLQQKLLSQVRVSSSLTTPQWILVPNATIREELRLRLAETAQTPLLNIQITTLSEVVASHMPKTAARWNQKLTFELLQMCAEIYKSNPEFHFLTADGIHLNLKQTFLDLAEGGVGLSNIDTLMEFIEHDQLSVRARQILYLYVAWLKRLDSKKLWLPMLLDQWLHSDLNQQNLVNFFQGKSPTAAQIYAYGFYEWTDLNVQLLTQIAQVFDLHIYLPYVQGQACYEFTESVLEDLQLRLGSTLSATICIDPTIHEQQAQILWDENIAETSTEPATWLSYTIGDGKAAELLGAIAQIITWRQEDPTLRWSDIGIIAPDTDTHLVNNKTLFDYFMVPARIQNYAYGTSTSSTSICQVLTLLKEQFSLELMIDFIRNSPTGVLAEAIDLEHFETVLRRHGVWGGASWKALQNLAAEATGLTDAETDFVANIVALIELYTKHKTTPSTNHVRQMSQRICQLLPKEAKQSVLQLEELLDELKAGEQISIESYLHLLEDQLKSETASTGLEQDGVFVSSIMRARGLSFKRLIILGLTQSNFPLRVEEDPLLPDSSRRQLKQLFATFGYRLPVKENLDDEMRMLFYLIHASAEKVHWILPGINAQGEPALWSSWVQSQIQTHAIQPTKPLIPHDQTSQITWLAQHSDVPYSLPPQWQTNKEEHNHSGHFNVNKTPSQLVDLSVTGMEQLMQCAYQSHAKSNLKIRYTPPLDFATALPPDLAGQILHAWLEQIFRADQSSIQAQAQRYITEPDLLNRKLEQALDKFNQLGVAYPKYLHQALLSTLRQKLDQYLQLVADSDGEQQVVALEALHKQTLETSPPVEIFGKIDRIDQLTPETLQVIDYKSGRMQPSSKKQLLQQVQAGFKLQPLIYPRLLAGEQKAQFAYIFLGETPPKIIDIDEPNLWQNLQPELETFLQSELVLPWSNELYAELGVSLEPCTFCELASLCRRHDTPLMSLVSEQLKQNFQQRIQTLQAVYDS